MPTANQRAASIADALVNGTSTPAQRQRLLAAFSSAQGFVQAVREFVLYRVTNSETGAPVAAVLEQVADSVETDFQEAP